MAMILVELSRHLVYYPDVPTQSGASDLIKPGRKRRTISEAKTAEKAKGCVTTMWTPLISIYENSCASDGQ